MSCMLSQVEHMLKNEQQFKCHICSDLFFSDLRSLKSHLTDEHSFEFENTFNCIYCDKELARISGLINHLKSSHKESLITNRLQSPTSCFISDQLIDSIDLDEYEDSSSGDEEPANLKACEIQNEEDSNSMDSSLTVSSSSTKPSRKETKTNENEKDSKSKSDYKSTKTINNKQQQQQQQSAKQVENSSSSSQQAVNVKTWTCQMCKKQFEQRVDLSKHQCIELNLKLLKKKKEIRKKKVNKKAPDYKYFLKIFRKVPLKKIINRKNLPSPFF